MVLLQGVHDVTARLGLLQHGRLCGLVIVIIINIIIVVVEGQYISAGPDTIRQKRFRFCTCTLRWAQELRAE